MGVGTEVGTRIHEVLILDFLLLNILINGLDESINNNLTKFRMSRQRQEGFGQCRR